MTFAKPYAEENPEDIAIRDGQKALTWAEVDDELNRCGSGLQAMDLGPETRIAVFAENAVETALANLGGLIAGASVVPVNFHLTAEEVNYILCDSGARVLFVGPETYDRGIEAAKNSDVHTVIGWGAPADADLTSWDEWLAGNDPAGPDQSVPPRPTVGGEARKFDAAILSVGVSGNTEGMGLEALGVEIDRGFIVVDEYQQTSVDGVYAIGDVAGVPCLAHKASHEGVIAVEAIVGEMPHPMNRERIPGCTYSHPQIASIGLSEAEAAARGPIKVGRFPLIANGKAVAVNDTDGMIKTIFSETSGELLGAHMIGPGVTEMIQGFAVAIGLETTEAELMDTIFPHPTMSEAMHESVLSAYGRTINF